MSGSKHLTLSLLFRRVTNLLCSTNLVIYVVIIIIYVNYVNI